jgi:hypothetical protein
VAPQDAMPQRLLLGLQDDPSFRWDADRATMLDGAREAGASLLRRVVVWKDTAPIRPANAIDPFDPAYRLDDVDDLVRSAQQRGMEILVTIWGTPGWANGGEAPNRPPTDPADLEDFATALADRYSGRHSGYPAVRLFSAWNEPNLEQFLAPQLDSAGRSVGPALYAPLARAVYDGVKRGNPEASVAIGETSPRGHDVPTNDVVQDSHSPARFARLLSEEKPTVRFDAWAQHPYPPRPRVAPDRPVRWPRVGIANLGRFGASTNGSVVTPRRSGSRSTRTRQPRPTRPGSIPSCRLDTQTTRSNSHRRIREFGCSYGSSSAIGTPDSDRAAFSGRTVRRSPRSNGSPPRHRDWMPATLSCPRASTSPVCLRSSLRTTYRRARRST